MGAWLSRNSLDICQFTRKLCLKAVKSQPVLSDDKGNSNLRNFHSVSFISRYSLYSDVSNSPVGLASYYEMGEVSMNVYGVF
jgi:hypothetical protein